MKKWNAEVFNNINISYKTMRKALHVTRNISEVDLLCQRLFIEPETSVRIFGFIESKYSSQIEGIYTTLFENINTGVESQHQKTIKPIVEAIFDKDTKLTQEYIDSIADAINLKIDKDKRWSEKFGIYNTSLKNKKEMIYQPPLDKKVVEFWMIKFFDKIEKDKHIIDHIIRHIMFEMIHPFPDANGRIGRMIFQKQMSKNYLFNKLLPISWAFYKNNSKYYKALDTAYTDMDKAVYMFLDMIDMAATTTFSFLCELDELAHSKQKQLLRVSSTMTPELSRLILFTLQTDRSSIEKEFTINVRTIDSIFEKAQNILPFNYKKVQGKVTYWNIELEELIEKHYKK